MDSIFSNLGSATQQDFTEVDTYEAKVRALIADACDYSESNLSPDREENEKYYYGEAPGLDPDYQEPRAGFETSGLDGTDTNRSDVVSTDVRDTVLSVLPSLIRIFTSSENIADFRANRPDQEEMAKQATNDVLHTFWHDNPGFMIIHSLLKDTMTSKIGVVTWCSDESKEVKEACYKNVTSMQVAAILEEAQATGVEVTIEEAKPHEQIPELFEEIELKYVVSKPVRVISTVPPEEFRIDRLAQNTHHARLIGTSRVIPASDVVRMGFDKGLVDQYRGNFDFWSPERTIRAPGIDITLADTDLVEFGEYYIRIDKDGDGIDELRRIRTLGRYDIIEDEMVEFINLAVFCGDPRPHTVVGDCLADLAKDIQKIKTILLRGAIDSLSGSMFPDLAINENMVDVEDVLADGVGRILRTKADPRTVMMEIRSQFVGADVFDMMDKMDMVRQSRTGISEASKGVDPKAFQSTNLSGIDAVVTGAQERIELIARILAETGFKDLMIGLLRETVRNPNRNRTMKIQGKWVEYDQSLYSPDLSVQVNPTLGKGSDYTKLATLQQIQQTQLMIMNTMGIDNPFVTPQHFSNTIEDMLAIANFRNKSRYFGDITPEAMAKYAGPKEPTPEEKIATAEIEKVKAKTVETLVNTEQKQRQMQMDDDFRRDKLGLDSLVKLVTALAVDSAPAQVSEAESIVDSRNQP